MKEELDPSRLEGDERVVSVRPIWVLCPFDFKLREEIDGVPGDDYFYEHLGGRFVSNCFGKARVYFDREEALADLAKCDLAVGAVWDLAQSGKRNARKLARAVLDGDLETLPILADALEDEGHPQAATVRELCAPPPKRGSKKKPKR